MPILPLDGLSFSGLAWTYKLWQHAVALRHAATSPNLYNDVILLSVLT